MSKKEKRVVKNKEQIMADAKRIERVKTQRNKAKNELYPLLLEASESIEDAKFLCNVIATSIKQAFNNQMIEQLVSSLDLVSKLNTEEKKHDYFKRLIEMFENESIASALAVIDEMPTAIDSFAREDNSKRPLSSLKSDFLD